MQPRHVHSPWLSSNNCRLSTRLSSGSAAALSQPCALCVPREASSSVAGARTASCGTRAQWIRTLKGPIDVTIYRARRDGSRYRDVCRLVGRLNNWGSDIGWSGGPDLPTRQIGPIPPPLLPEIGTCVALSDLSGHDLLLLFTRATVSFVFVLSLFCLFLVFICFVFYLLLIKY